MVSTMNNVIEGRFRRPTNVNEQLLLPRKQVFLLCIQDRFGVRNTDLVFNPNV